MKVKIKILTNGCMPLIENKGDLFDVYIAENVELKAPQAGTRHKVEGEYLRDVTFDNKIVGLGFAMEIPKGFKANLYPRSSTYNNYKVILANSVGQVDNSYNGNNDEWKVNLIAFDHTFIPKRARLAQFEIIPSCKATVWQKLKWLFSKKIKFVVVDDLENPDRGGFGKGTGE